MKRASIYCLLVCISLFYLNSLAAQGRLKNKFYSAGLGHSVINEFLPEGNPYTPLTALGNFSIHRMGKFTIYGELQLVQTLNTLQTKTDYEFGTNFGFMFNQPINKELSLVAAIGSGPHFISVITSLQASGFIFSDNFELGFLYEVPEWGSFVTAKARFRHISNAGIENPNGGIDNGFVVIGIGKLFN